MARLTPTAWVTPIAWVTGTGRTKCRCTGGKNLLGPTTMVEEARSNGAVSIAAVGTAGLRIAPNRADLIDAVQERSGVGIDVISGEEEARLAYLAATSALDIGDGSLVLFDTGGVRSGAGHSIGPAEKPSGRFQPIRSGSPESPGFLQYTCQPGFMTMCTPT